jgi:hypothetical protein
MKRILMGSAKVLIGIFFSLGFAFGQSRALTVCQALSELDRYRGEIVEIRGLVQGNLYHGLVLRDFEIKGECPMLAKSGRHWPSAIRFSFPPANYSPPDGPLNFVPDTEVINKFLEDIRRLFQEAETNHNYNICYRATFIGELRSRKDISISIFKENSYAGNGYGQAGQYPAVLHLKTIVDLHLVDLRDLKRE